MKEERPYPNEHSARLKDQNMEHIRVRRTSGSGDGTIQGVKIPTSIDIIWYIVKKDNEEIPIAQALRFPIKTWTEKEARKWLKDNEIKYILFEAAGEDKFSPQLEKRTFPLSEIRIEEREDKKPVIKGHAAVFNQLSEVLWGNMREKIARGAFTKTIEKDDIRALFNHDPNFVLGRNKNDTLRLKEDDTGLAIEIDPPDTTWAKDLATTIKRKDVDQMSFGFYTKKDEWDHTDKTAPIRTLIEVDLFDVSPVTFPAYPQTDVGVRNIFQQAGIDFEKISKIIARSEYGIVITEEEKRAVQETIQVLTGLIAERQASVPDYDNYIMENLKRRLQLAEKMLV